MRLLILPTMILSCSICLTCFAEEVTQPNSLEGVYMNPKAEFWVAIKGKGNWPKLKQLENGELIASFYNHPSHGFGNGDIELWVSSDEGRNWAYRSTVTDHSADPEHCRMNHAVGKTADGRLIIMASGWSKGRSLPILPAQVCISDDDGRTWQRHEIDNRDIPFGNIILAADGRLVVGMYDVDPRRALILYESKDDGQT
ncbi:MAG: sialidase family protein [Planctomycetaceae bacterium]